MNLFTPKRYDERIVRLALGIEPLDATSNQRAEGALDVRIEKHPAPLHLWRGWRPGETLTAVLPRLRRHRSGRFARCYHEGVPAILDVRIADSGIGRRFVPRRTRLDILSEATVLAADSDPTLPPVPGWRRVYPIALFPGASAPLPSRATVLRGRVTMTVDPATGRTAPVRWCRVQAQNDAGADVGWAHGDERGEFVLVTGQADTDLVVPSDPLTVTLTIGALLPPATADPADPLLTVVDPLWDLPVEPVVESDDPLNEPTMNGRRFLTEQSVVSPLPPTVDLPLGRETSIEIRIA